MLVNLMAVGYFTAVYQGIKLKVWVPARHPVKAARRVFGIPNFCLYALTDWWSGKSSISAIIAVFLTTLRD
jgi:hypothetical protein